MRQQSPQNRNSFLWNTNWRNKTNQESINNCDENRINSQNQAKNQANRLGIEKYINFTGSRTNINDYLYSSDIYVSPSLGEGLPLTLLEAGQAGLPVVATDVTGNNEVIRDGQSGLLVPPSNPEKLAQAIVNLYQQPLTAKRYASALQNEVREKFGLQHMLDQTLELYHEILSKIWLGHLNK